MFTTRLKRRRRERDKPRFLANELLALGIRDKHPYQQVYNVANEIGEGETVNGTFRILGGHRVSEWAVSDYAALVVSSFYSSSIAEPTAYNIVMSEAQFEQVRDRLKLSGLACGLEHFWLTQRKDHPLRMKPCLMCELLADHHPPFISTLKGWGRNTRYTSEIQAEIAIKLLEAATVAKASDLPSQS